MLTYDINETERISIESVKRHENLELWNSDPSCLSKEYNKIKMYYSIRVSLLSFFPSYQQHYHDH